MGAFLEVFDIVLDYMVDTEINLGDYVITFWGIIKFVVVGGIGAYMIGRVLNPD